MGDFFEGWYLKQCNARDTLALIPGRGGNGAFVQVVTDDASYFVSYPLEAYRQEAYGISVGDSFFSLKRTVLNIRDRDLTLTGEILCRHRTPPRRDVMGLLRHVPVACRHGVLSLHHALAGEVNLNGQAISFVGGIGYAEQDSGSVFPDYYTWVQANDFMEKCCIMVAVAKVAVGRLAFRGVLCVLWYRGKEYRLATDNGARVIVCTREHIVLRKGKQRLEIKLEGRAQAHPLMAPANGGMLRTIYEVPACSARFRFLIGEEVVFDLHSDKTSFEYVPEKGVREKRET